MMVKKTSMKTVDTTLGVTRFFDWVGAQSAHGVDLLGDYHRAQFARHSRSVSARDHQPRNHWTQFANHANRNQLSDQRRATQIVAA